MLNSSTTRFFLRLPLLPSNVQLSYRCATQCKMVCVNQQVSAYNTQSDRGVRWYNPINRISGFARRSRRQILV